MDDSFQAPKTIQYGLHALIRLPSDGLKIIEIQKEGVINLGKFGTFDVGGIIGFPYGQSFEIIEDRKVRAINGTAYGISDESQEPETQVLTEATSNEGTPFPESLSEKINYLKKLESSETNKDLLDIGSATQSLTMDEIETLKRTASGVNVGEAIIDKLIKSHANFDKKTKHSQEKYLRRKQQKFLRRFTVESVGSSQLLQYFIEKDISKVLDLSEESLGLLINLANVQPGGRYLAIDETGGIIIAAMLERMGGRGEILILHENEHANHSALSHIDIPQSIQDKVIKTINLLQFFEPEEERIQWKDLPPEEIKEMKSSKKSHYYRRRQNAIDINAAIDNATRGGFDGLIVASTLHLPELLDKLVNKIGGSRPIVIYNQFKEPLIDIQIQSMEDLRILAPTLHETKCRPYQTIPGRLHPLMSMRGGGGYLYSALRVFPIEEGVVAVGRGLKKRKVEKESD